MGFESYATPSPKAGLDEGGRQDLHLPVGLSEVHSLAVLLPDRVHHVHTSTYPKRATLILLHKSEELLLERTIP